MKACTLTSTNLGHHEITQIRKSCEDLQKESENAFNVQSTFGAVQNGQTSSAMGQVENDKDDD